MSEESTTPDLVELTRRSMEASNRGELHSSATFFAPDAVFDVSSVGVGRFEGPDEIHGYLADWYRSYESQELREWDGRALGGGVVFVVCLFEAKLLGSESTVQEEWGFTLIWSDGMISRVEASRDIAEARCCRRAPRPGTEVGDVAGERGDNAALLRGKVSERPV